MTQFIKTPFSGNVCDTLQVSQITYRDERIIDINYCRDAERAVIQDNQELFYFHSPDIENITIREILYGLGYGNNHIVVTWVRPEFELRDVLDIPIVNIPLSQLSLYDTRYPVPNMDYPDDGTECDDPVDSEDEDEEDDY